MKKKLRLTIDFEADIPENKSISAFGSDNITWNLSGINGYQGQLLETNWNISEIQEESLDVPYYSKEFRCGNSYISRAELEVMAIPFNTKEVSDETMQALVDTVDRVTKERAGISADKILDINDDRIGDIWWEELETVCKELKIPYYNENEN